MAEIFQIALKLSLVIFMVGNLLDMGLKLKFREALGGLRNVRFVILSVLWGFGLCPALAYVITKIVPLEQPYAIGLILLGMAPCAPFLPMMAGKARGDMAYAAAFMLLASVITVVFMPLAVPVMLPGLSAGAWTIAKPLLFFLVVPLAIGMSIQRAAAPAAARLQPIVKKATGIDTILMLVLCVIVYGKGFLGAMGSYAFGAQILFFSVAIPLTYVLSFGLPPAQKSILVLGISTRNLGAAFAPLFAIQNIDQRAIVMVAIGVPMQTIASWLAACWFARRAPLGKPGIPLTWLQYYRIREFFKRSLWIFPILSMVMAMVIVRIMYQIDMLSVRVAGFDSNNIRNVLCTLASSMFTFIVFVSSALLIALQVASTQMTPRIIPLALTAPMTKLALSVFTFTFTYLLAVFLRTTTFVPLLSTRMAIACCLVSMGLFFILLDNMGKFLRPSGALEIVAKLGRRVIEAVYVRKLGPAEVLPNADEVLYEEPLRIIVSPRSGVVLALDIQGLASLAGQFDCVIEMVPQVGDFVAAGEPLFRIFKGGANLPESALFQLIAVGLERTLEQDATFVFRIIVDIASKGLSPAINDPTTAVLAIDQIHRLLRTVGCRDLNEGRVRDATGRLRFVYQTPEWEDFVYLAVTEIRHFGAESIQVVRRLRAMLENLIQTLPEERTALLYLELELLNRSAQRIFLEPEDQALANASDFQGVGGHHWLYPKHGQNETIRKHLDENLSGGK